MVCFSYSVIKFIPDPVKDERVNIGVIVVDNDGNTKLKFITNFKFLHTRYFSDDFDLLEIIISNYGKNDEKNPKYIESLYENSLKDHRIKVDSPRAIISESIDAAVKKVYSNMISVPEIKHSSKMVYSLDNNISNILYDKIKMPKQYVKRFHLVSGNKTRRKFDYVFMNGHVTDILQRISFDVAEKEQALQRVKSFDYDSSDIRAKFNSVSCVAYIPVPENHCEQHDEALKVLHSSVNCNLVDDDSLEQCLIGINKKYS